MKYTKMKKNFNLIDVIDVLKEGKTLSNEMVEYSNTINKRNKENGINFSNSIGGFEFELRDFVSGPIGTKTEKFINTYANSPIMDRVTKYENLKYNSKLPYLNENSAEWLKVGNSSLLGNSLSSEKYQPHRLTTTLTVSIEMLHQTDNFEKQFGSLATCAFQEKLISSIFSSYKNTQPETDERPSGVISYCSTVKDITSISDILDLQNDLDIASKSNCSFVVSPSIKKMVFNESNDYTIFNNGCFLGSECFLESKLEDSYILYFDLSKLVVCQWSTLSMTVDKYSSAKDGLVYITLEGFYDFGFVDNTKFLGVGKLK